MHYLKNNYHLDNINLYFIVTIDYQKKIKQSNNLERFARQKEKYF